MFRASELAYLFDVDPDTLASREVGIEYVIIDSRQVIFGSDSMFVAIAGQRTDGHRFIRDAWEKGVRNFLVSSAVDRDALPESNVFHVDDTIAALQKMAEAYRSRFDIPFLGITGSNGKTWVKEWLAQLLVPDMRVVRSPRSYNSQIGVPLSVLLVREEHDLALIEAGISVSGEMNTLQRIIRPQIGILTNIGDAHDSGFESREEKLRQKLSLFRDSHTIIAQADNPMISRMLGEMYPSTTLLTWGASAEATLRILSTVGQGPLRYSWKGKSFELLLPFIDSASIQNALTCLTVLHHLGVSQSEVIRRIKELRAINMRLEMHAMPGNRLLINDTYSLDLASLRTGLETLGQHSRKRRKVLILSDIDEQHASDNRELTSLIKAHEVDAVYVIGEHHLDATALGKTEYQRFKDLGEFMHERPWDKTTDTAFLLKGARRFGFERVVGQMRMRTHSALLEIDLNAMLENLRFFANRLTAGTKVIAMVKAAAYGSGSVEVAKFLEHNNIDMLCVAYVDEGVELRKAGITLPIIVLNPDPSEIVHMIDHRLEPEVYSFELLEALHAIASSRNQPVQVHLMLDTGMHRLGFAKDDIPGLLVGLPAMPSLRIASTFTHLSASDDPTQDEFTQAQVRLFEEWSDAISSALTYVPMRHVLNSAGTLRFPEYHFDAVRLGIGLYGLGANSDDLSAVHTLRASVSQVRRLSAGETVGYGRRFRATKDLVVSTVNVGYADGLPRAAERCAYELVVRGQRAPIIGSVCMDMCMVDVTDIESVQSGDEVVVFGPENPVERLAECCNTIAYEILTGISDRLPRVFKFD